MKLYLENWYEEVHQSILKTDMERYEQLLEERKEKLESYQGTDKRELLQWILSKDESIKELIADKAEMIKKRIIAEDIQHETGSAYKLYE